MAGIGVCTLDDIAISVMATVIGHRRIDGSPILDAGWTALSSDRGTAKQTVDQRYGVVCDLTGIPYADPARTG
jgi:D-serine deaminase-like pyridoxal phosphate-dependent protein